MKRRRSMIDEKRLQEIEQSLAEFPESMKLEPNNPLAQMKELIFELRRLTIPLPAEQRMDVVQVLKEFRKEVGVCDGLIYHCEYCGAESYDRKYIVHMPWCLAARADAAIA